VDDDNNNNNNNNNSDNIMVFPFLRKHIALILWGACHFQQMIHIHLGHCYTYRQVSQYNLWILPTECMYGVNIILTIKNARFTVQK